MTDFPLLSLLVFLPAVGALFLLVLRGEAELVARNARNIALWTSVITFGFSLLLWTGFDTRDPGYQFEESAPWIADPLAPHARSLCVSAAAQGAQAAPRVGLLPVVTLRYGCQGRHAHRHPERARPTPAVQQTTRYCYSRGDGPTQGPTP